MRERQRERDGEKERERDRELIQVILLPISWVSSDLRVQMVVTHPWNFPDGPPDTGARSKIQLLLGLRLLGVSLLAALWKSLPSDLTQSMGARKGLHSCSQGPEKEA